MIRIPAMATLVLAMLCAPTAACDEVPAKGKDVSRVLNPRPKHIVRIEGRVPKSLEIAFGAEYWTHTEDRACYPHPLYQWGFGPNTHRDAIEVKRKKNGRFTAELVVDKYLPGPCNWALRKVDAAVVAVGKPDEDVQLAAGVIGTYYYYDGKSDASGCDITDERARRSDKDDCPILQNALDTPVLVPCKVEPYDKNFPKVPEGFYCAVLTKARYKETHRLKPGQKRVLIDFYDLDNEPDPTE